MGQDPGNSVAQGNESTIGSSLTILLSHAQSQQPSGLEIICSQHACNLDLTMTLLLCQMNYMLVFYMYVVYSF